MSHPFIMTRYSAFGAGTNREIAKHTDWMSSAELQELAQINDQQRRQQWAWGRRLAKRMIRDLVPGAHWTSIEILSRQHGRGHRPQVRVNGEPMDGSLSIAHTSRGVFVGLAAHSETSIGVDLASEVPADERFQQMWFTTGERRWMATAAASRISVLWALKEAVFKAGNSGQPWSPRQVEILPMGDQNYKVTLFGQPLPLRSVDLEAIDGQLAATVCLPRENTCCVDLSGVSVCL